MAEDEMRIGRIEAVRTRASLLIAASWIRALSRRRTKFTTCSHYLGYVKAIQLANNLAAREQGPSSNAEEAPPHHLDELGIWK